MDNPAQVFADEPHPPAAGKAAKAPLGWWWFVLQLAAVALVYLIGSTLPLLPTIVSAALAGGGAEPELGSATVAATAMVGMALALGTCWLWLRRNGQVHEAFGLAAPADWRRTLVWAVLATAGALAIFSGMGALVEAMGLPQPDPSFVLDLVTESPAMFALWVVGVAWLAAGMGEELLYRGFLMDRLERLAGLRGRAWLVLLVQAALFGLPHAYQGLGGVLVTGAVGLLLGWVRMRQGGNLWAVILAHAAVDTISMSMAYAGASA